MQTDVDSIIAAIEGIESVEVADDLQKLEDAVDQLFKSSHPERGVDALLRLFERFPESDGYGLFRTILHGLERLPDYEHKVIESVQRKPARFNVLMVNRMMNAGVSTVGNTDLLALLRAVATNPESNEAVREDVRGFLEWQS